jgi:hypothetical protein
VDLSFKESRSGLALLASVSFTCSSRGLRAGEMGFRIPILSQEAYSDTYPTRKYVGEF